MSSVTIVTIGGFHIGISIFLDGRIRFHNNNFSWTLVGGLDTNFRQGNWLVKKTFV